MTCMSLRVPEEKSYHQFLLSREWHKWQASTAEFQLLQNKLIMNGESDGGT